MRRADRLFQIIQILRRTRRPLTAESIAAELETSKRTVYRDIAALIGQLVPIRGEAGMGYVIEGGFDLPPLMLTPDEIEAAVLGAQWVAVQGDAALAKAARDLVAKIGAVVAEMLRPFCGSNPPLVRHPAGTIGPTGSTWPICGDGSAPAERSPCITATNRTERARGSSGRSLSATSTPCAS